MTKHAKAAAPTVLDLGLQAKPTPELQAYFDKCQEKLGFVPNVLRGLRLRQRQAEGVHRHGGRLDVGRQWYQQLEREISSRWR